MPMTKRPIIRNNVLILRGLVFVIASGTAIPIMKTKDGNIKSAGERPSHAPCLIHQGACGPLKSTIIIPKIVSPLRMSSELSLCFSLGGTISDSRFYNFSTSYSLSMLSERKVI